MGGRDALVGYVARFRRLFEASCSPPSCSSNCSSWRWAQRGSGPARSGAARRRSGVAATQDRRLPSDAAGHASVSSIASPLPSPRRTMPDPVQRASSDEPIRLRPRPHGVCRKGRGCAARPPSRGVFPLHRHRHARAGADPRRANSEAKQVQNTELAPLADRLDA